MKSCSSLAIRCVAFWASHIPPKQQANRDQLWFNDGSACVCQRAPPVILGAEDMRRGQKAKRTESVIKLLWKFLGA